MKNTEYIPIELLLVSYVCISHMHTHSQKTEGFAQVKFCLIWEFKRMLYAHCTVACGIHYHIHSIATTQKLQVVVLVVFGYCHFISF